MAKTTVIYDKDTYQVLLFNIGEEWVMPERLAVTTYGDGVEPILIENDQGTLFLKPNSLRIKPSEYFSR